MNRNINLSYLLAFSKTTWFWLGIWVFYYLRFTNYAGIGLIETILILTMTLAEIPTGAVADLLGKKKTLIIAFLLEFIGSLIMATAINLPMLILSVFIMCVGGAFYSGTIDALVFDSLKQSQKEKSYPQKISRLNTISLITPAVCSIVGGFLYKLNPSYPFFGNSLGFLIGLFASLFLIEPKIDTEKFSFSNFVSQTQAGFKGLFKTPEIITQTLFLLSIGFFVVIADEMLNGFLGIEFGFQEHQLGILWSVILLLSAFASLLTSKIHQKLSGHTASITIGILICLTFLVSPYVGLIFGGISLALRSSLQSIFNNLASIEINNHTQSKYRATTISTFNMIKNIPYLLTAFFIGSISDQFSAKYTALYLGLIMLVVILVQSFTYKNQPHHLISQT